MSCWIFWDLWCLMWGDEPRPELSPYGDEASRGRRLRGGR